jgi:hypothetical protein
MARLTIAAQTLSHGLNPTFTAIVAADDAQVVWEDGIFFEIQNAAGSSQTVTIKTNQSVDGLTVPDLTIVIPDGETRHTKSFPKDTYRQADGKIYINTTTNGVSLAAIRPA